MNVNIANMIDISTVDYQKKSATVIFFRGCNYNCCYCHNSEFITGETTVPMSVVTDVIDKNKKFISSVVFSGGEPTLQPEALTYLADYSKRCGLNVGIHTNGTKPEVIRDLIDKNLLDKVFMDVKADPTDPVKYNLVAGRKSAAGKGYKCDITDTIDILMSSLVDVEYRTTVFKMLYTPQDIINIMHYLSEVSTCFIGGGEFEYAIQTGRKKDGSECPEKFDIDALKELIENTHFYFSNIIYR